MRAFKFRDLVKHSLIYGIGGIAQSGLGFILLPVLTAKMSLDDFGVYSLVLMSATIAGAIFYLGMTSAMPRSYFDFSEEQQRKSIFTNAFIILVLGALVQIAIGYYFAAIIAQLVLQSEQPQYICSIQWAFLGSALTFINQYFFSFLRLKRCSVSSVFFSISGLVVGAILTIWLLNFEKEVLLAPFKAIAFTQIVIAVSLVLLYGKQMFTWSINFKESKPLLHFGLATVLTSFGLMTLDWADRIIIERYISIAEAGLYSAAYRVSGLIGVLMIVPFTQIWSPMMLEYQKNQDIKKITSKVLSYFLIAGALILSLMALFASEILHFLIKYEITQTLTLVFLILALASIVNGTANIVVAGIFYERKIYLMPFIYAAIAGIKIILNIILVPFFGISAAAFNTLITSILIPCTIYYFSKKYFSFEIEWSRFGKLAFLSLIPISYCISIDSGGHSAETFAIQFFLTIIIFIAIYKFCLFPLEKTYMKSMSKNIRMAFLRKE